MSEETEGQADAELQAITSAKVDVEGRRIYVTQRLDGEVACWFIQVLAFMDDLEENGELEPIHVYVNSPGGDVAAFLAMYDAMRCTAAPIITHLMGEAASGGAMLFIVGDTRVASEHSALLLHEPQVEVEGRFTAGTVVREGVRSSWFAERLYHILEAHTHGHTQWRKLLADGQDHWFMGAEALRSHGLADITEVPDPEFKPGPEAE